MNPTQNTDYCFTVEDEAGCLSPNACITITVTPELQLDLTPPTSICDGETVTLNASGTGGNGNPYIFDWMEGSSTGPVIGTGPSIDVTPSVDTWYYVLLTDGCTTPVLDSTLVSINANPVVFLNVLDSTGCDPFNAQFTANSDIGELYEWDFDCDGVIDASGNNMTSPSWLYDVPGTYDVCLTVTSVDGCVSTISEPGIVTVHPTPVAEFSFDPATTTILNPTITFTDLSTGALVYDWDFGDGYTISGVDGNVPIGTNDGLTSGTFADPIHTYVDTGEFVITLFITNAFGCTSTISYTVHIEGDYILFAPSAFTPNGDGKNDYFYPQGVGIDADQFEMYIFDRWGEIVFESHHPDNHWDGVIKGTGIIGKTEVYVWLIRTVDHLGDSHEYIGHVTLLK